MREKSYKIYGDFSGGSCEGMAPSRIPDNALAYSNNVIVTPAGLLSSRQGMAETELIGNSSTDNAYIFDRMTYWAMQDGSIKLVAMNGVNTVVEGKDPYPFVAKGHFAYREKLFFSDGSDLRYLDGDMNLHSVRSRGYKCTGAWATPTYPTAFPAPPAGAEATFTTVWLSYNDPYAPYFETSASYTIFGVFKMADGSYTDKFGIGSFVPTKSHGEVRYGVRKVPNLYNFASFMIWMSMPNSSEYHLIAEVPKGSMTVDTDGTLWTSHLQLGGTRDYLVRVHPIVWHESGFAGRVPAGTYEIGVATMYDGVESTILGGAETTCTNNAVLSLSTAIAPSVDGTTIAAPQQVAFYRRVKGSTTWFRVGTVASTVETISGPTAYFYSDNIEVITDMPVHIDPVTTAYDNIVDCKFFVTSSRTMRAYAAGDPAYPHRVYFSDINNPATWNKANYLEPSTSDGPIYGLAAFYDCILVIFRNTCWALKGLDPEADGDAIWFKVPINAGTNQPRTIVQTPSSLTFLSSSGNLYTIGPALLDMNVTVTGGEDVVGEVAGPRLKEFFADAVKVDDSCFATYLPNTNELILGAIDSNLSGGSHLKNRFVVVNWASKAFFPCEVRDAVPTAAITMPNGRTFVALHGESAELGGNYVREWNPTDNRDYYDNGAAHVTYALKKDLSWCIQTKKFDLDSPNVHKHAINLIVEFSTKVNFTLTVNSYDGKLSQTVTKSVTAGDGSITREEIPLHIFGTQFDVRIEGAVTPTSANAPFELHTLTFIYRNKRVKGNRE